jgi:transcriptional regulator with AAA-type ATPase domain
MKEIGKILAVLAISLKTMAQGINVIAEKIDEMSQARGKETNREKRKVKRAIRKTTAKTPKAKKPTAAAAAGQADPIQAGQNESVGSKTAADTVLDLVKDSADGIKSAAIMEKTGFDKKKVANILFKLGKQGKIKAVSRGVYMIA